MSCSDVIKSGDECIFEKEFKFNKIITDDLLLQKDINERRRFKKKII